MNVNKTTSIRSCVLRRKLQLNEMQLNLVVVGVVAAVGVGNLSP